MNINAKYRYDHFYRQLINMEMDVKKQKMFDEDDHRINRFGG